MKMKNLKVLKVESDNIQFSEGYMLFSNHDPDCCESHYLDFSNLSVDDFDGLEFNLEGDDFFNRIEDYGIELMPVSGHSVKIPGYGYNNGYYSSNIDLIISKMGGDAIKKFDVSECQIIEDYK